MMWLGPKEDSREPSELRRATIRASDRVKGLLDRHREAFQKALPTGVMPEDIRGDFRSLAITPTDILEILKESSCRQTLADVLDIQHLKRSDLSLEDLKRAFAPSQQPAAERLVQACKLLFSTSETSCIGTVILRSTFYPAISEGYDLECFRQVVGLMRRQLAPLLSEDENYLHPAFENWNHTASKVLLWSYGLSASPVSVDAYMQAAQLGRNSFGSLEDPADCHQAVRLLREFIPQRSSEVDTLYSQPVPMRLQEGFTVEGLGRVLREFPLQEQVIPWMREMLAQVGRAFQDCSSKCAGYGQEVAEMPWQSESYFEQKQTAVKTLFSRTVDDFANVCGFFTAVLEQSFQARTEKSQSLLRQKLQRELGQEIASTIKAFCAALSEPKPNLPCTTPLALALDELIREKLELPLDIEAEQSEFAGHESVYQGGMLNAFRQKVRLGDLSSALNMRCLFPLAGEAGTGRDTVDQYINDNQHQMIQGVSTASRLLSKRDQLGPDAKLALDVFRDGLRHLIRPESLRRDDTEFVSALSGLVRALVALDTKEEATGMTSSWGCRQAALVLQRIRGNGEFMKRVASKAFSPNSNRRFLAGVAEFISCFNSDESYEDCAGEVRTLYEACSDFHEQLPVPKTLHLSVVENMQGYVVAALRKWRGGLCGRTSGELQALERITPFLIPSEVASRRERPCESIGLSLPEPISREAHVANLVHQWELTFQEAGGSLAPAAYHVHAMHLGVEARRLLHSVSSREFEQARFQAVFAELLIGVLSAWSYLAVDERREMVKSAEQMLRSIKACLLCTSEPLCFRVLSFFAALQQKAEESSVTQYVRETHLIDDLLSHWKC